MGHQTSHGSRASSSIFDDELVSAAGWPLGHSFSSPYRSLFFVERLTMFHLILYVLKLKIGVS